MFEKIALVVIIIILLVLVVQNSQMFKVGVIDITDVRNNHPLGVDKSNSTPSNQP